MKICFDMNGGGGSLGIGGGEGEGGGEGVRTSFIKGVCKGAN